MFDYRLSMSEAQAALHGTTGEFLELASYPGIDWDFVWTYVSMKGGRA